MKVLLVEDEDGLASAITSALQRRDCILDRAASLWSARAFLEIEQYDVMVLDRRLPDGDGLSLLSEKASLTLPPTLVLTAMNGSEQTVIGLNSGADDYMVKPFDVEELFARLRALKRRGSKVEEQYFEIGNLKFDTKIRELCIRDRPIKLPRRELLLIEALMGRPGHVIPRNILEQKVFSVGDEPGLDALAPHVSRLRRRLEDARANVEIVAMRGIGYILRAI